MESRIHIITVLEGKKCIKFPLQDSAGPASHPHMLLSSPSENSQIPPPRPAFLLLLIIKCAAFFLQQLVKLSRSTADPLYMQICTGPADGFLLSLSSPTTGSECACWRFQALMLPCRLLLLERRFTAPLFTRINIDQ